VSTAGDSQRDHPAAWGGRRVGPDLARVGGRYTHLWHYQHLQDPRAVTFGSNMPPYGHLAERSVDVESLTARLRSLRALGAHDSEVSKDAVAVAVRAQGELIVQELATQAGVRLAVDSQLVALIAYLQSLGLQGGA
jgi:cytochrome c oxidase cbb3-type subunit I/II